LGESTQAKWAKWHALYIGIFIPTNHFPLKNRECSQSSESKKMVYDSMKREKTLFKIRPKKEILTIKSNKLHFGNPLTTQAGSVGGRSSCPMGASRAQEAKAGVAKMI